MTQSKSGYSSNIITAIAAIIILLAIMDTVKFWAPLIGVKDLEALSKELDPMKPQVQVPQEAQKEASPESPDSPPDSPKEKP